MGVITEFGWEPGNEKEFYIVTSDGVRHSIPEEIMRANSNAIDLRMPYPFQDQDGVAVGLRGPSH